MPKEKYLPTVLLLSGGSLVGQNIIQALGYRRNQIRILATNSTADEPSLKDFDEVRLVPPTFKDMKGFERVLAEWLEQEHPVLVIPCRDDDIVFLARYAEQRPELAHTFLCGASIPAQAMLDKWESWLFSCEHGLPFAPTVLPTDQQTVNDFLDEWDFPLLVKPRAGFASTRVRLIQDISQLHRLIGDSSVVVQKYLGPPEPLVEYLDCIRADGLPLFHSFESMKHSIQAMIGPDGQVDDVFTTQHRMRNGISVAVDVDQSEDAKALGVLCARVFSKTGWRGPLNIQCQRTPQGSLSIYEFNGRFTGATAARALLGYDEVGKALARFSGTILKGLNFEIASGVLRQPTSRSVVSSVSSQLCAHGVWCRPTNAKHYIP